VSGAGHFGEQAYDRWFLLGEKRNEQLSLPEVSVRMAGLADRPRCGRPLLGGGPGWSCCTVPGIARTIIRPR